MRGGPPIFHGRCPRVSSSSAIRVTCFLFTRLALPFVTFTGRAVWAQQEVVTAPRSSPATPHADGHPAAPPVVVASPDVAVHGGGVSAGTRGKLVVAQQVSLSEHLRSTLQGSVAFASPGAIRPGSEVGVRAGALRWELGNGRGYRTELRFTGDPLSRAVHSGVEAPLPGTVSVTAFGDLRWTRTDWGEERVGYGQVALRRRFWGTVVVEPGMHVVDVRSRDEFQWTGTTLRLECRGAEFFVNHEGARGSRVSSRKTWRTKNVRLLLGGQLKVHPEQADHGLLEMGVIRGRVGIRLYEGDAQRAIVVLAGPLQFGFSRRAAMHQTILGYESVSLSFTERANGATEVGLGFVFRGLVRNVQRTAAGWHWQPPLPAAAIEEPHVRWPGLASLLD